MVLPSPSLVELHVYVPTWPNSRGTYAGCGSLSLAYALLVSPDRLAATCVILVVFFYDTTHIFLRCVENYTYDVLAAGVGARLVNLPKAGVELATAWLTVNSQVRSGKI